MSVPDLTEKLLGHKAREGLHLEKNICEQIGRHVAGYDPARARKTTKITKRRGPSGGGKQLRT